LVDYYAIIDIEIIMPMPPYFLRHFNITPRSLRLVATSIFDTITITFSDE